MMSNSLGKYYQKQRKVTKRARERYQNLSEKKKEKKVSIWCQKIP